MGSSGDGFRMGLVSLPLARNPAISSMAFMDMTASPLDLALYAGATAILFATPGPVWVAIIARGLSGGFRSAWPLALGVVVGDAVWPLLAILGVAWLVSVYSDVLIVLKGVAVVVFLVMGAAILKNAGRAIASDSRLTKPGIWAGFLAGLVVILSNPKAILFYMGVLPGFLDLSRVTELDIAAVVAISIFIPLAGNLMLALSIDKVREFLSSPAALRRTNVVAGSALMLVGVAIPFI